MPRRWIVRPLAESDIERATAWYERPVRAMGKILILDPERTPLVRRAFQDFA
jgi:hypothetical protein